MKITQLVLSAGVCMVFLTPAVYAHGDNLHGKPKAEVRFEVKDALKNKTTDESWDYVDGVIKDLAKGLFKKDYKVSREELVKLKKSLDIVKMKYEKKEKRRHVKAHKHEG